MIELVSLTEELAKMLSPAREDNDKIQLIERALYKAYCLGFEVGINKSNVIDQKLPLKDLNYETILRNH